MAALWTIFAAWCAGVQISALDPLAMFVAVWMLYAADRLLDARHLTTSAGPRALSGDRGTVANASPDPPMPPELEERHFFHHRHRGRVLPLLVLTTIPLAFLLHRLATPVLRLYALLAVLLAGWLMLVHAQPPNSPQSRRLPKELAVGLFFPAAVFIPTVARAPNLQLWLLPGALLFAGVCTLNCLFLYAWEHEHDRSNAHATTRFALHRLPFLTYLLFSFSTSAVLVALLHTWPRVHGPALPFAHPAAFPAACALSVVLLLALHIASRQTSRLRLRALADLALLTPLIPMLLTLLHIR